MSNDTSLRGFRKSLPQTLKIIGSGVVVLVLFVAGFWGSHLFEPAHPNADQGHETDAAAIESEIVRDVTLPKQKVAAAGIHTCYVDYADVQRTKTVAATVEYDSTRLLTIKAPVECVVERWLIRSGQLVKRGEALATLSGTEIALARSEIKKNDADVRVKQINFDWSKETHDNLKLLLATLQQKPSVDEIEGKFESRLLGEHREHLLKTYTKFMLSSTVAERTKPLGEQGIVSGRTAEARLSDRDVASTEFKAACEQSEFDAKQALAKSEAELEFARQQLAVSKERLSLLLGPLADALNSDAGKFEVLAPFDGRIELLATSPSSRLDKGDDILRLADTTILWISSLVHQHDWGVLQVDLTESVKVSFPAVPGERFDAKVSFVGPEVSPTTRAISVVAELKNASGRFRPGMFAWVDLPIEAPHKALVVPTSALQRHESKAFVFVTDGENRFRRVDVTPGFETPEQVEIKQGLVVGQTVVDQGAFYLKSELLLEQEE